MSVSLELLSDRVVLCACYAPAPMHPVQEWMWKGGERNTENKSPPWSCRPLMCSFRGTCPAFKLWRSGHLRASSLPPGPKLQGFNPMLGNHKRRRPRAASMFTGEPRPHSPRRSGPLQCWRVLPSAPAHVLQQHLRGTRTMPSSGAAMQPSTLLCSWRSLCMSGCIGCNLATRAHSRRASKYAGSHTQIAADRMGWTLSWASDCLRQSLSFVAKCYPRSTRGYGGCGACAHGAVRERKLHVNVAVP